MKRFTFVLSLLAVIALAGASFAGGDVRVSWSFTSGYPGGPGWGGPPWGQPAVTPPLRRPMVYGPTSYGYLSGGNWGFGWSSGGIGWNPGRAWGGHRGWRPWVWSGDLSHFPPGTYVIQPWWVGSLTIISTGVGGYGWDYADYADAGPANPPRAPGGGVFLVPVSGPPRAAEDRLDGIRTPLAQPTVADPSERASDTPRPRKDLDGIGRIFRAGGLERAETELGKILRSKPSDPEVSGDYAWVLFLREKYATSAFCLRRAILLDPKFAPMGSEALSGFYDARQSAAGLARIGEHLAANPTDNAARLVRAWALLLEGRTDDARADLDVLLKADPDDAQATALRNLCPASAR